MRQLSAWLSALMLAAGCSANQQLPLAPTPASSAVSFSLQSASSPTEIRPLDVSIGNWLPWYWGAWQPGAGEPLDASATIDGVVAANDVCVSNLRQVWDARSSCRRFLVSVPSEGRLEASLRWDASAPGFDESLAGEVVFVARDGRFASSDWQRSKVDAWAEVEPGDYTVLVITYVPVSLPFQLTMTLR